jgi:hypothetical protein
MSDSGKAILDTLDQVRSFFQELARMFGALDPMMSAAGWSPVGGTTVINQTSQSLSQPRKWMPQYVFRVYTSKTRPELLAVVKVLMSREYQSLHREPQEEPLLVGLILDFGKDKDAAKTWQYDFATWHPKLDGRTSDGRVSTLTREPDKACPAVRFATWAVPLASITDSKILEMKTVDVIAEWTARN